MSTVKLGVLGSTKGTDLQAIIDAIADGRLYASVEVVLSNRKKAYILERARNHGIENVFISHKGKEREQFDREMTELLESKGVELILLIGFMRILSPWFCFALGEPDSECPPFPPPQVRRRDGYERPRGGAKNNETETGCTIHIVTAEVDGGPIVVKKSAL